MIRRHLQSVAALAALAAIATATTASVASAKPGAGQRAGAKSTVKSAKTSARPGAGTVAPVVTTGGTAIALEAFPTGGKGSATEETCHDWTIWLREDQEALDQATTTVGIIEASDTLKADKDAAMDAGCAVID